MIAQISQRYRPEGMSEQAGAQEDILGLKKKKTFKDKIINTWWGRKKKFKKKKLKTEAISVMSGTHSITSVLPLG